MQAAMKMAAILVFSSVFMPLSKCQSCAPFDTLGPQHTMCLFPPNSGCPKIFRGMTQAATDEILAAHNEYRLRVANGLETNQPSATNMRQLKWNDELATVAQRWTDQCTFGHDTNRKTQTFNGVGQNVATQFFSANTGNPADIGSFAVDSWYNEVADFDRSSIEPFVFQSNTGHYTQVVWAETTDIGCGYAYYLNGNQYTKFIVCNYGPGGNIMGATMYREGTPCTECANGCSTSYPGLCN